MAVARLTASYAGVGLDYTEVEVIFEQIGPAKESVLASYQVLIENEAKLRPAWLTAVPRGRRALRDALTVDAAECFRRAGAFEDQPASEVVTFMDRLANMARAQANLPLVEQGRYAERLSFEHELTRCAEIPGAPAVVWVALDDNSAGYDILSCRLVDGSPLPRLVEVKSCRSRPLQLIITRNEWDTACRHPAAYVVHFWDLNAEQLHELSWGDLQPHLPLDQGAGRWETATLNLTWLHGF